MNATLYLAGPWSGDASLESEVAGTLLRLGSTLCQAPEAATGLLRVRRVGRERWLEPDERVATELLRRPRVAVYQLTLNGSEQAQLYRVKLGTTASLVPGPADVLELPSGIDDEDLVELAFVLALGRVSKDEGKAGAIGTRNLFFAEVSSAVEP